MSHDISNTAVVILLVLTILVALAGTWTVLETAGQARQLQSPKISSSSGQVTEMAQQERRPAPGDTSPEGKIELTIVQ